MSKQGQINGQDVLKSLRGGIIFLLPLVLLVLTEVQNGKEISVEMITAISLSFFIDLLRRSQTDYTK